MTNAVIHGPLHHTIVDLPPVEELGPAMRALPTDTMRRFVVAWCNRGDDNKTQAVAEAGYIGTPKTWCINGIHLLRDQRILEAIHEECVKRLHAGKALAVNALLAMVSDPLHRDHAKATFTLLNRTGLNEQTTHSGTVKHEQMNDQEIRARIRAVCTDLGIDPKQVLGAQEKSLPALPAPVDAEFEEVGCTEGIEDLL